MAGIRIKEVRLGTYTQEKPCEHEGRRMRMFPVAIEYQRLQQVHRGQGSGPATPLQPQKEPALLMLQPWTSSLQQHSCCLTHQSVMPCFESARILAHGHVQGYPPSKRGFYIMGRTSWPPGDSAQCLLPNPWLFRQHHVERHRGALEPPGGYHVELFGAIQTSAACVLSNNTCDHPGPRFSHLEN